MTSGPETLRCVAARVRPGPARNGAGASQGAGDIDASAHRSAAAYRAAARRLRGRFAGDPVRLQRSLLELARREDACSTDANGRVGLTARPLQGLVDGTAAERFAALVERHLDGPVLCYSERQSLLRAAARLGIGRFDANLIIAVAQHRAESGDLPAWTVRTECSQGAGRWWPAMALVLALEATFSLVAWWAVCG